MHTQDVTVVSASDAKLTPIDGGVWAMPGRRGRWGGKTFQLEETFFQVKILHLFDNTY